MLSRFITTTRKPFANLSHNVKVMMATEPCWAISISFIAIYLPIYMKELGLNELQIGWVTFFTVIGQIGGSLLGGYMADHWGRKKTLIAFDALCWSVPILLWYFARGFGDFAIAALFWGFGMIVIPSWLCLFSEESTTEQTQNAFTVFWFILSASGFFVPLGGLLVKHYGTIGAYQIVCIFTVISVSIGISTRARFTRETKPQALKEIHPTSPPLSESIQSHIQAGTWAWQQPDSKILFISGLIHGSFAIIWGTFAPIYWTDKKGLQLSESIISLLPLCYAVIMCLLIAFVLPQLQKKSGYMSLLLSTGMLMVGILVFILTPAGAFSILLIYACLYAGGAAIYNPTRDSLFLLSLTNPEYRAKVLALGWVVALVISLPIGPLGGYLYKLNPKYPFIFCLGLEIWNFILLWRFYLKSSRDVSLGMTNS